MSRIHPNARAVGYATVIVVLLLIGAFVWRIWSLTRMGHEHLVVQFAGSGELMGALQPDDPVLVRGVDVGMVQSITQQPGGVQVKLRFWGHQGIFRDAIAVNTSHSLMGQRVVDLDPGRDSAHPIPADASVPGYFDPGVAETMSQIYKVLDIVTEVRKSIVILVSGDGSNKALYQKVLGILQGVDRLLAGLESASRIAERSGPTIARIGNKTAEIHRQFPGIEKDLRGALTGTDSVLITTRAVLTAIAPLLDSTRNLVALAADSTGPMKHVLLDDSLIVTAQRLEGSLNSLMTLLEGEIPMKFRFHILGSNPSKRGE